MQCGYVGETLGRQVSEIGRSVTGLGAIRGVTQTGAGAYPDALPTRLQTAAPAQRKRLKWSGSN